MTELWAKTFAYIWVYTIHPYFDLNLSTEWPKYNIFLMELFK